MLQIKNYGQTMQYIEPVFRRGVIGIYWRTLNCRNRALGV